MKELAKSIMSLSWAVGLTGARGMTSLFDRDRREKFLSDSERLLRQTTDATVDTLGRDLRETFRFGDEFQRRAVDAGLTVVESLFPKTTGRHFTPRAPRPKDGAKHAD